MAKAVGRTQGSERTGRLPSGFVLKQKGQDGLLQVLLVDLIVGWFCENWLLGRCRFSGPRPRGRNGRLEMSVLSG